MSTTKDTRSEALEEAEDGQKETPKQSSSSSMSTLQTVLAMTALCMATFLAALDMTIITTALPTIVASFNSSAVGYSWIGASYLLAAAAATPSWGKISDIFGRKPILLAANVVFFIGSLICALSVNLGMLLAGRAIQGVGGGGLTVMTQICIGDLFSMRARAMFYGIVSLMWAFSSGIGPIIGGAFTQDVSWRWCFYVNLPVDGAAFLIILFFIKIETPKTPLLQGLKAIDWMGSITVIGGTVMLLLGLNFGSTTSAWNSAEVICLIVFGGLLLLSFLAIEAWIPKRPIMPLRIFNNINNVAALLVCFCQSLVFMSGVYYLPVYFQNVLLASPLLSGVYLLPFVVSLALAAFTSGILIRKLGKYRPSIWFGMFFLTLGFGLFIDLPAYASWPRIIIFQLIAGIGTGPNFQAPLIALQNRTQPQDLASATGAFLFTRNLATAMSVVFGSVIFQARLTALARHSTVLPASIANFAISSSVAADRDFIQHLPLVQRTALAQIYTSALRDAWIFFTCVSTVGLVASFFVKAKQLSDEHKVLKQGLDQDEDNVATADSKVSHEGSDADEVKTAGV